jgi:hypothetical protein
MNSMSPNEVLREQILRYQQMTGEERLAIALRLHELAFAVARPHMLAGSMASNYWGIPRTTHDIDFVLQLAIASIPPPIVGIL